MRYTQQPLIKAFKEGKFPGESSRPKHIESLISNVFVFEKNVYKFYKDDNHFFNEKFQDISKAPARFSFTQKDFAWNHALSPSIYKKLIGVSIRGGKIQEVPIDQDPEELVLVMTRVDMNNVLFERLIRDTISADDCYKIGQQLASSLSKIQRRLPGNNFYQLFETRIGDLRNWVESVTDIVPLEEWQQYCNFLEKFRVKNKDLFEGRLSDEITIDGDFHTQNAVHAGDLFLLMDTYAPKDEWGVGQRHLPVYRIGVDIWALSGKKEYFDAFVAGYESASGTALDRYFDDLYIVYASVIAVSFLYQLQKTDSDKRRSALKFHAFLKEFFQERNLHNF